MRLPLTIKPWRCLQPTGPPCRIALKSFLIAGRQMDLVMISSTIPAHVYEVRPRKDNRGVDLIFDDHSVACGMAAQMQSATQSTTRSFAAAYTMP